VCVCICIFFPLKVMSKRALERNEPFGLLNADASVGTLASMTVPFS